MSLSDSIIRVLHVPVTTYTKKQIDAVIESFVIEKKTRYIVTPNPEMVLYAKSDMYLRKILEKADLSICDGFGLRLFAGKKIVRYPGVDCLYTILGFAQLHKKSVYFVGSRNTEIMEKAVQNIKKKYPDLHVSGYEAETQYSDTKNGPIAVLTENIHDSLIRDIEEKKPDIVIVALGHGKQEKWIHSYGLSLKNPALCIGVGGALDMISEKIPRAPSFLRFLGLEWFWRLLCEPSRIQRIFKAVFVFPYYLIKDRYENR